MNARGRVQHQRFDVGSLAKVERTPQGGLRVKAHLTRVGVFTYDGPEGAVREYRAPEEVFDAASLDTLPDAPLTIDHPGMVTPDNHGAVSHGHVRDVKQDGSHVEASLIIQNRKAIKAVEDGMRQVSCGYTCRVDAIPGVTPSGEPYDRVQREIRYNHVALVDKGRAGPDVRLRLDQAGNQSPLSEEIRMDGKDQKFERLDGVDYEVGSDAHRAAVQRRDAADKVAFAKLAEATAAISVVQAKFDAAEAKRLDAEKKLAEALDVKRLDAAVTARLALIERARSVLGPTAKFDGLMARQIHEQVVAKAAPQVALEGRSDDAMAALFEAFTGEGAAMRADAAATHAVRAQLVAGSVAGTEDIMKQARLDRDDAMRNAWKTPPSQESA